MIKNISTTILTLFLLLSISCSSPVEEGRTLLSVDITGGYPEKILDLSEIADIEYIQFKSPDTTPISKHFTWNMVVSDNNMILKGGSMDGDVYIFNSRGEYISSFNRMGRSREEYTQLATTAVDFEKQEIAVDRNFMGNNRGQELDDMLIYNFEGYFQRSFNLPDSIIINSKGFFSYDEEHYFAYCDGNLVMQSYFGDGLKPLKKPYLLISKEDGAIKELDLTVKDRVSDKVITYYKEGNELSPVGTRGLSVNPFLKAGNNIIISDFALDTVYNYRDDKLTPIFTWDRINVKEDKTYLGGVYACSDDYYFLTTVEKPEDEIINDEGGEHVPEEYNYLYIDRSNNEVYSCLLELPDIKGFKLTNSSNRLMDGVIYVVFDAFELIEMNERGELSGKLKELADNLDEEGNPVLVVIKFK